MHHWVMQLISIFAFHFSSSMQSCEGLVCIRPGPEVKKHFSSSAQLSMKFQLLTNTKSKLVENSGLKLKN